MAVGVTSTSSSAPMNSIALSSVSGRGGVRRSASSWECVRMLVSFFSLRRVDVHVARAGVLADDHPLVDVDAGADEQLRALLEVEQRRTRSTSRSGRATSTPFVRWVTSPAHGP